MKPGVVAATVSDVSERDSLGGKRVLFVANEVFFFLSHRKEIAQAAISAGIEVHLAAPADHVWAPVGFDHEVELREIGIQFHELPMSRRGRNLVQELRALFVLGMIFRLVKPDITHFLTIKPIIYGCVLARVMNIGATVVAFTGLGHVFSGREFGLGLIRFCVMAILRGGMARENLLAMFQSIADRDVIVTATGVDLDRTRVVPGAGVDLDRFRPKPSPSGAPVILLPARLIWEKGIGEFVAAARVVKSRFPHFRFVLV